LTGVKRILLLLLAILFLVSGLVALFPAQTLILFTGWHADGLQLSFERELTAFGGGALVAALWALVAAFRRRA
jgi:hypothetical protein